MQAIILAAGKGTRLRPLTHKIPKTLVSVAGKPILEHTLQALPPQIKEVVLVVGYKGDHIKRHLGDTHAGRKIIYVQQTKRVTRGDANPHGMGWKRRRALAFHQTAINKAIKQLKRLRYLLIHTKKIIAD